MERGTCGKNLTWTLDNETLTISGIGAMKNSLFYVKELHPQWLNYSRTIEKVVIEYGITSIGNAAFFDCSLLKNITIPNSVTSIGEKAFWFCSSLKSITIPDSVISIGYSAFFGCKSLTSIIIPDSVTTIDDGAFNACSNLKSVTIPDSVKSIGDWVFFRCDLAEIHYPAGSSIESKLRKGNKAKLIPYTKNPQSVVKPTSSPVANPKSQSVVKSTAQLVIEKLRWKIEDKTLTVDGVREIKSSSYEETLWRDYLNKIQKIVIEDGVEEISANAFKDCTALEQLIIPASVKTIGDFAFAFCYCGERKINNGKNVIWSLDNGVLLIKKNPAAKSDADFSTGFESWQVVEKNITSVKVERGIVPGKRFFDWLYGLNSNIPVTFS